MEGLGDVIDKVTTATGVKTVVNKVVRNCGCEKRRQALNVLLPFKKKRS